MMNCKRNWVIIRWLSIHSLNPNRFEYIILNNNIRQSFNNKYISKTNKMHLYDI